MTSDERFLPSMQQFPGFTPSSHPSIRGDAFKIITHSHHFYTILQDIFLNKIMYYYVKTISCYNATMNYC